jgi:hypothetical protein
MNTILFVIFVIGYAVIALEHPHQPLCTGRIFCRSRNLSAGRIDFTVLNLKNP